MIRAEKQKVMYVSILYRLASIIMMLSLVGSGHLYPDFSLHDYSLSLLSVSSLLSLLIYRQVHENADVVRVAVIIESLMLILILLLTGGLHSPVMWLVITPAVFYLFYFESKQYMIGMLTLTVMATIVGPYLKGYRIQFASTVHLPALFITMTMLMIISLLANQYRENKRNIREVVAVRKDLEQEKLSNQHLNSWLNNSYSLIENLLLSKDEKEGVYKIFSYCALAIPAFGFYIEKNADRKRYTSAAEIDRILVESRSDCLIREYEVEGVVFLARFGFVYLNGDEPAEEGYRKRIELILKITALFFERNELLQENEALLISSEQKRIAEEMHDGLNQDLHGTTYMLYDVIKNHEKYTIDQIIEKLSITYDSIKDASQSLKKTIYRLSQTKQVFEWHEGIMAAATRLKGQYDIFVTMEFDESVREVIFLSPMLFDAFKRIIKESAANSVEHGGADKVVFKFSKEDDFIILEIVDNGVGFVGNPMTAPGLGMKNMQKLVSNHDGELVGYNNGSNGAVLKMSFRCN